MNLKRQQLTLFVDSNEAKLIEEIREKYNPEQFKLIASHVTLCREDEIENIENVLENLQNLNYEAITICFEKVIRFSDDKGVLMPAIKEDSFQRLRKIILNEIIPNPKNVEPHITLMHPRNSCCGEEIFWEILQYPLPSKITFSTICLIEQINGQEWQILREFKLGE